MLVFFTNLDLSDYVILLESGIEVWSFESYICLLDDYLVEYIVFCWEFIWNFQVTSCTRFVKEIMRVFLIYFAYFLPRRV